MLQPLSDSRAPRKAKARKTRYYDEDDEDDDADEDEDGPDGLGEWAAVRRAHQHVRSMSPTLIACLAAEDRVRSATCTWASAGAEGGTGSMHKRRLFRTQLDASSMRGALVSARA